MGNIDPFAECLNFDNVLKSYLLFSKGRLLILFVFPLLCDVVWMPGEGFAGFLSDWCTPSPFLPVKPSHSLIYPNFL